MGPLKRMQQIQELVQRMWELVRSWNIPMAKWSKVLVRKLKKGLLPPIDSKLNIFIQYSLA